MIVDVFRTGSRGGIIQELLNIAVTQRVVNCFSTTFPGQSLNDNLSFAVSAIASITKILFIVCSGNSRHERCSDSQRSNL